MANVASEREKLTEKEKEEERKVRGDMREDERERAREYEVAQNRAERTPPNYYRLSIRDVPHDGKGISAGRSAR